MHDYKVSMIQTRRDLHKMTEMGWGEFKTTAYIIDETGMETAFGIFTRAIEKLNA